MQRGQGPPFGTSSFKDGSSTISTGSGALRNAPYSVNQLSRGRPGARTPKN